MARSVFGGIAAASGTCFGGIGGLQQHNGGVRGIRGVIRGIGGIIMAASGAFAATSAASGKSAASPEAFGASAATWQHRRGHVLGASAASGALSETPPDAPEQR